MCDGVTGGVGRNVVVRVAEIVGDVEHPIGEEDHEHHDGEDVLDRGVGGEGHRVLARLDRDAGRVVLARNVQGPDVQGHHAGDHEGQEVVQGEEAVEGRVAHRVAAPEKLLDGLAHQRDGREQVGDHRGAPEAHLAPGKHVAHEGGGHHEDEDDHAEDVQNLAGRLVGPVVEVPEDVEVDGDEEHRRAVGVQVAQEPAIVHVAHDVLDGLERHGGVGRVVHGQEHAGDDLGDEHEGQDGAEGPEIGQVPRHREGHEGRVDEAGDRQAALEPLAEGALGNVGGGMLAHDARLIA
jgi:hypothetical protein